MSTIPGQPYVATVAWVNAAGQPYDPYETVVTVTSQHLGPAQTVVTARWTGGASGSSTDSHFARTGTGMYTYTFIPTSKGTWTAVADAFDQSGNQIGAQLATVLVVSRPAPAPAP